MLDHTDVRYTDAYSIGPRPSGLGAPPTGALPGAPGSAPVTSPAQAPDAGQDAYVTGNCQTSPSTHHSAAVFGMINLA